MQMNTDCVHAPVPRQLKHSCIFLTVAKLGTHNTENYLHLHT